MCLSPMAGILSQMCFRGYEIRKRLWIIAVHEGRLYGIDARAWCSVDKIAQRLKAMLRQTQAVGHLWRNRDGVCALVAVIECGEWAGIRADQSF